MSQIDSANGYEDLWSEAEQAIDDFADGRTILESDIYYGEDGEGYYWECTVDDTDPDRR